LRNELSLGNSLNVANKEVVEALLGLSIWKSLGNNVDLPSLLVKDTYNTYVADNKDLTTHVPTNFKVVHSNLFAFSTKGKIVDQEL